MYLYIYVVHHYITTLHLFLKGCFCFVSFILEPLFNIVYSTIKMPLE